MLYFKLGWGSYGRWQMMKQRLFLVRDLVWKSWTGLDWPGHAAGQGAFIWGMEICSQASDPTDCYHRWCVFSLAKTFMAYTAEAFLKHMPVSRKHFMVKLTARGMNWRWKAADWGQERNSRGNENGGGGGPWKQSIESCWAYIFPAVGMKHCCGFTS